MRSLIRESLDLLNNGTPFALAVIIGHKGSTPRTSGSKMLVRLDKSISGTIGGGLVEAKVMDACVDLLDRSRSEIMDFHLDQEIKAGMDMVCGGSLTVWLRSFVPPCAPEQIQVWQRLADLEAKGKKALAVTRITADKNAETSLVLELGEVVGPGMLPKALMDAAGENRFTGPGPVRQFYGLDEFIIEPLSRPDTLYIFGAGHVGFQLAKMAHLADFSCVVVDDRAEFANEVRFPHAGEVRVLDDFSTAFDGLDIDDNAYIVILTRGHLHDQTVLEQALKTSAAYIGMIGSKKKKKQIYDNLMEKGVVQARLEQVYAPIGLKIKAETPAEIAVSIMGELIKVRAENKEQPRLMPAALIPAAGLSSRMGRYKPLLPLGRSTMIGTVIGLFKAAGIREIIVVTGHNHDRLAPAVEAAGARPLFNPDYAAGMFSSIRTGVAALPSGIDGFFLLPADIPAIRPATLNLIRRKFEAAKDALIIPAFNGETGHPPLIPARLITAIIGADPDANLRQILFSDPSRIIRLPVHDRGILMDADTPEGYDQIKQKYERLEIPDEAECLSVIDRELADAPAIRAHLERVCETALTLAWALRTCGLDLDTGLIRAGALLHDIKRKEAHHAEAGSRFLQQLGFQKIADIVAVHMDLTPGPELDETQIVFLADKLCRGDQLELDYPGRFHEKAKQLPHAKKEIFKRLETAQHIHARIESVAGRSLGEILG